MIRCGWACTTCLSVLPIAVAPVPAPASAPAQRVSDADWPHVNRDRGGTRYSPLTQINTQNVSRLRLAWTYHTGDATDKTTIECTPIVVDGVMYITTARTKVVALDAATGSERWALDPYADTSRKFRRTSGGVNRGVAFWSDGRPDGQRRILAGLSDGRLLSIDARTGRLDPAFGEGGELDLRQGIERDISNMAYGPTSAPLVFEDLAFVGFSNDEGHPAAPGDVRAFDVRTGRERWRFHTVPRPGEFGYDTWPPDAWKDRGGANAWGGFTLDETSGVLFCGTGSAGADFFGGDRKGANLFANCTLALDARTGRRLWHFQTVHHDLWDHDLPCPPILVALRRDGRLIEAVAQLTKTGYCFVFNRKTGRPLFPVHERPAPPSDIPGEEAYPTQPVPERPPPIARQRFTQDDITDRTPQARAFVAARLRTLRHGGSHIPPSIEGSVVIPGFHGGATWSGGSYAPTSGYLYVNSNEAPTIARLRRDGNGGCVFAGYEYFVDDAGYPAIRPPWGRLIAIDLNTGDFAWQVPLGEFPELAAVGLKNTGTETFGGTIVTAGGLVFIGGSKDEKFRAFDAATGKLLWEYQLPAGGYATPCTYAVAGRQYVAIAAGGGGKLCTRSGDAFVAFALPE